MARSRRWADGTNGASPEDAELSFRLLRAGWSGLHVDRSFGKGIMPLTFEALKGQRLGGPRRLRRLGDADDTKEADDTDTPTTPTITSPTAPTDPSSGSTTTTP